jgi:hypothetical protein
LGSGRGVPVQAARPPKGSQIPRHRRPDHRSRYRRLLPATIIHRNAIKDKLETASETDKPALESDEQAIKILANATSYGIFVDHGLPRVEIAAVSQCAGNSRIFMQPRVAGAQWANGSMSNTLWTGVRLKDVLDRAGVKAGAVQVRFGGLDEPVVDGAPKFMKSLTIDHARDGEVMIAFGMNGEQLQLLNGFPLKLIVPGWCAVYWIKMLNDIEVLDQPDMNYWTTTGYRYPDTPHATVKPGQKKGFELVPVTRNLPRSFITNIQSGDTLPAGAPSPARGIAFGGDCAAAHVDLSIDGGGSWKSAQLGTDEGKYGFRRWQAQFTLPSRGAQTLMIRCTNTNGEAQPEFPVWNPAGYMRNTIESTQVVAT